MISRGASTDLLNAGKAEIMGLDLEMQASVTDNLTLRLGASLLDTEYTEFETGILCSTRLPDGHTVNRRPARHKGNALVRSPEQTFNLG